MTKRMSTWFVIVLMAISLTACGSGITLKNSSESFIGSHYESVIAELERSGFVNIEKNEIADLKSSDSVADGSVTEVSINGETSFAEKSKFEKEAKVIVTYRSIPKATPSLSEDDLNTKEVDVLIEALTKDGFSNITYEELYDLDPEE